MSEPRTMVLVGASGLVGTRVLEEALGRADLRVVALGRRAFLDFGEVKGAISLELTTKEVERWLQPTEALGTLGMPVRSPVCG